MRMPLAGNDALVPIVAFRASASIIFSHAGTPGTVSPSQANPEVSTRTISSEDEDVGGAGRGTGW
jgi:hypothetical protein